MKKLTEKDKKNRKLNYKYEIFRFALNNIIVNKKLKKTMRWNIAFKLINISKKTSKTILSNRCILSNRKSSIIKKFKFSRITLLRQARSNFISGLLKV